jgi:hypothetical protein
MKPLDEMKDLLEVILEEDNLKEDNQEVDQQPQLPKFQYLLLQTFRP